MKPKFNEQKQIVVSPEGLPVFVNDKGEEIALDADRLFGKVTELNAECKRWRESKEILEAQVKQLQEAPKKNEKPSEDIDGLRKQMAEMKASYEKDTANLAAQLNKEVVFGQFARSGLFNGTDAKTVLKPEVAYKLFGDRFAVKNGQVVALEKTGSEMYSRKDVTSVANFEEALDVIMDEMGVKNDITRVSLGSGSGGGKAATPKQVAQAAVQQAINNGDGDKVLDQKLRSIPHKI